MVSDAAAVLRERFGMASACALAIFSGKIILNFAFVAACGPRQTHFHEKGRKGSTAFAMPLSAKAWRGRGYPFCQSLRLCHLPQGDGFNGSGKVSGIAQRRPLGGAGTAQAVTEGVLRQTFRFNSKVTGFARGSPFEERLPPAGGRCRVATKRGICHRR